MQITLTYSDLYGVMDRSLSIIGKRSIDEKGNRLFNDITFGSREKELANDYFRSAIVALAADLRQFVSLETQSTTAFTITITLYEDYNDDLDATITQAIKDYIVAYALYSWFVITAPRIYEKYLAESERYRSYIRDQVFHRQRPATLPDPLRQRTDPSDNT